MNFQNKKLSVNKKVTIFVVVALLVIGLVAAFVLFQTRSQTPKVATTPKPAFTFHSDQASGWYTAGNNWVNPDEFTGDQVRKDELPVADMSVHQGSNEQDIINGHCFTIFAYFNKTINIEEELKKSLTSTTADDGRIITETGVNDLTMMTHEGLKSFQLHKYDISGPAAQSLQRGMANGYVQLSGGHIRLQSICQESSQLDETVSVFKAASLDIRATER